MDAISDPPADLWIAARCLGLIDEVGHTFAPSLAPRIASFREHVAALVTASRRADQLGDPDTPPAAIFDILGAAADHLPLTGFDPAALIQLRVGVASRAEGALRILQKLGLDQATGEIAGVVAACYSLASRATTYQSHALFVDASDSGLALGVHVVPDQSGSVTAFPDADSEMLQQGRVALEPHLDGRGCRWDVEWPVRFEGSSIGLALYVGWLVATGQLRTDPLLAATGRLDIAGSIHGVEGIPAKVRAAALSGVRRLILPEENRTEAEVAERPDGLELIFVSNAAQVRPRLMQATARASLGSDGLIRYVRNVFPLAGLEVDKEEPRSGFYRFVAGNASGVTNVDVYPNGTVHPSGSGTALASARAMISEYIEPLTPKPRQPLSRNVPTSDRRTRLHGFLEEAAALPMASGAGEAWRYRMSRAASQATIVLYNSGKCVIQGQAPAFDEAAAILDRALEGLRGAGGPTTLDGGGSALPAGVDPDAPHIGTDEAGKGDFFGPLVSAAVYVDKALADQLRSMGVKDSKQLSDKTVRSLAANIRRIADRRARVTTVPPKRFNELYAQMSSEGKNLNTLLAWTHTRSIEDLIKTGLKPAYVIIDQFGDRKYIETKLLADTRESGIPIVQMPKAEADIAVAAASVLARDGFLEWLDQTASRLGRTIPKGASDAVIATARAIVAERGRAALNDLAKTSFRTMEKVLAE